jgi:hypothetical protein
VRNRLQTKSKKQQQTKQPEKQQEEKQLHQQKQSSLPAAVAAVAAAPSPQKKKHADLPRYRPSPGRDRRNVVATTTPAVEETTPKTISSPTSDEVSSTEQQPIVGTCLTMEKPYSRLARAVASEIRSAPVLADWFTLLKSKQTRLGAKRYAYTSDQLRSIRQVLCGGRKSILLSCEQK